MTTLYSQVFSLKFHLMGNTLLFADGKGILQRVADYVLSLAIESATSILKKAKT